MLAPHPAPAHTRAGLKAYLEPVAFVLRICEDEAAMVPMPWPYVASATVTLDEVGTATIRGLTASRPLSPKALWNAVATALSRIGASRALWSRKQDGESHVVSLPLTGTGPLYL